MDDKIIECCKFLNLEHVDFINKYKELKQKNPKSYVLWPLITSAEFDSYNIKKDDFEKQKKFYESTINYIFELSEYNITEGKTKLRKTWIDYVLNKEKNSEKKFKILDFGCGVGQDLIDANLNNLNIEGIDFKGNTLDFCKYRINKLSLNINLHEIDCDLPVKNKYDIITCFEVIMQVPEPLKTLKHLCEYINKDGYLIMTYRFIQNHYSLAHKENVIYEDNIEDFLRKNNYILVDNIHMWGSINNAGKYLKIFKHI
jgi:2-polyprenyl-3-methyl-5-hydroxy-6-metoxy-1,4-benzoquinol methylase